MTMNSLDAVKKLLQNPMDAAVMEETLPVIREDMESVVPYIKEVMRLSEETNSEEYTPIAQLAAAALLGEAKDAEGLNAYLDMIESAGDLSEHWAVQNFVLSSGPLTNALYLANPNTERLMQIALDDGAAVDLRSEAVIQTARAFRNGDLSKAQVLDFFSDLLNDDLQQKYPDDLFPAVVYAAGYTGLPEFYGDMERLWKSYEDQCFMPLEDVKAGKAVSAFDAEYTYKDALDGLQDAQEGMEMQIDTTQLATDDLVIEEAPVQAEDVYPEDPQMESLLDALEKMSTAEIQTFAQANPQLIQKLTSYVKKRAGKADFLKSKKKTAPSMSLSDFQSKKKKKGGSKPGKSAKSGKAKKGKKK